MKNSQGFTTIELLITLFVGFAFIATFFQLFTIIDQSTTESRWQSTASNLAYTNLRKFSTRPASFTCNSTTDLTLNAFAPGQVVFNQGPGTYEGLPGQVSQEIRAYAPAGCGPDLPTKLESTVTFGDNRKVTHATYVN